MSDTQPDILIVEDGDEYLRFFSRHVGGYRYHQARSLASCVELLDGIDPVAFVLDLRFDRVPREDLIGDVDAVASQMFGDGEVEAAWRYIEDNQGYLILRELRDVGYAQPALIIAELPERRQENLRRLYGAIGVVPSFDPGAISAELQRLTD